MGVGRNINGVGAVGCIQHGNGGFLSKKVGTEFSCDLVVGPPNSNLERVGASAWQNVVDGVVVQPIEIGLAFSSVKLNGDDERSVNAASNFEHRVIGLRTVEEQFSRLGPVGEHRRDGVVERTVGAWLDGEGHGVTGVCAALTVERVTACDTSIARIHFCKVVHGSKVGGVDGSRVPIEHVGRAEQTVEFCPARGDVFPCQQGRLRSVVKHGRNVLRLQILRIALAVGGRRAHWSQGKKHDCGKNNGAQTTVLFSLWATHQSICALRPL